MIGWALSHGGRILADPTERRKSPRHPCDRELEGRVSEAAVEPREGFPCHAVNASTGGMMLETRDALDVGQRIELSLRARDGSRSIMAEAEVVWTQAYGEVWHCGVKFLKQREDYVI